MCNARLLYYRIHVQCTGDFMIFSIWQLKYEAKEAHLEAKMIAYVILFVWHCVNVSRVHRHRIACPGFWARVEPSQHPLRALRLPIVFRRSSVNLQIKREVRVLYLYSITIIFNILVDLTLWLQYAGNKMFSSWYEYKTLRYEVLLVPMHHIRYRYQYLILKAALTISTSIDWIECHHHWRT